MPWRCSRMEMVEEVMKAGLKRQLTSSCLVLWVVDFVFERRAIRLCCGSVRTPVRPWASSLPWLTLFLCLRVSMCPLHVCVPVCVCVCCCRLIVCESPVGASLGEGPSVISSYPMWFE